VGAQDTGIPIVLTLGQDRLLWIDVGAHDGLRLRTVSAGQSQEILQDRILARAGGATAPATPLRPGFDGSRGMDRGDRYCVGPRERHCHFRGAARDLGAGDRENDTQRAGLWLLEMPPPRAYYHERSVEAGRGALDPPMETTFRRYYVPHADREKAITLTGFLSD